MIGTILYKPIQDTFIDVEKVVTDTFTETIQVPDETSETGFRDEEVTRTEERIEYERVKNDAPNTREKYAQMASWCNQNNATIEDKGEYFQCVSLPEPTPEEMAEALYRQYQAIIQNKLDSEAIKLGYDNADRVVARQNSTHPKYRAEGVAFNIWYDELWGFGNDLLNKVMAGKAEIPTPEDFEAMLPKLVIEYPAEVEDGATDE